MRMLQYHDIKGHVLGYFDAGKVQRGGAYDIIRVEDSDFTFMSGPVVPKEAFVRFYDFYMYEIEFYMNRDDRQSLGVWVAIEPVPKWVFERGIALPFEEGMIKRPKHQMKIQLRMPG